MSAALGPDPELNTDPDPALALVRAPVLGSVSEVPFGMQHHRHSLRRSRNNLEDGNVNSVTGSSAGVNPRRCRVLVVDDSQMSRKMLARLLQGVEMEMGRGEVGVEEGGRGVYEVECLEATDGQAAVDLVKRLGQTAGVGVGVDKGGAEISGLEKGELGDDKGGLVGEGAWDSGVGGSSKDSDSGGGIDVVVMDCNMPRMSGPEATFHMRALGYQGVILGLSGETREPTATTLPLCIDV